MYSTEEMSQNVEYKYWNLQHLLKSDFPLHLTCARGNMWIHLIQMSRITTSIGKGRVMVLVTIVDNIS